MPGKSFYVTLHRGYRLQGSGSGCRRRQVEGVKGSQDGHLHTARVFDNAEWGAVRKATRGMYPKGHAMKANRPALISLAPSPHYHQISQACGGWGERVEDVNDLPKAIDRALSVVRTEKRQALLSVACG